jgi:hypothetical protein
MACWRWSCWRKLVRLVGVLCLNVGGLQERDREKKMMSHCEQKDDNGMEDELVRLVGVLCLNVGGLQERDREKKMMSHGGQGRQRDGR